MTAQYLDIFRSKIAAYTWRYKDIPEKLINEALVSMHCKQNGNTVAIDQAVIRVMVRAIENKIIDYDDLTRAGYSAVVGYYAHNLHKEVCSSNAHQQL